MSDPTHQHNQSDFFDNFDQNEHLQLTQDSVVVGSDKDMDRKARMLYTDGSDSLNFSTNDRLRRASIDNTISSIARDSAAHTEGTILRKSLVSYPALNVPETTAPEESLQIPNVEVSESTKSSNQMSQESYQVEESSSPSFEEKILENRLLDGLAQHISSNSIVSPIASTQELPVHAVENPLTLVEDKRASELQEYVPEPVVAGEPEDDFDPSPEQLMPVENHAPPMESFSNSETILHSRLPWDDILEESLPQEENKEDLFPHEENKEDLFPHEENKEDLLPWNQQTDEPLPWQHPSGQAHTEANIQEKQQALHEPLPWEQQNEIQVEQNNLQNDLHLDHHEEIENVNDEPLPWSGDNENHEVLPWDEHKDMSHIPVVEESSSLPWNEHENDDPLPWEGQSRDMQQLSPTLGEGKNDEHDSHHAELIGQEFSLTLEESKLLLNDRMEHQDADLLETSNELATLVYNGHLNHSQETSNPEYASNIKSPMVELFNNDNLEHDFLSHVQPSVPTTPLEPKDSKVDLDELFNDDDDEFLEEIKNANSLQNISTNEPSLAKSLSKDNEDKFSNLELELDDDLLLDDDFLDSASSNVKPPISKVLSRSELYRPSGKDQNHYAVVHNSEKEVVVPQVKSDFCDFPDNLISKKVRPATRNSNSHSSKNSNYAPPAQNMIPEKSSSHDIGHKQHQSQFKPISHAQPSKPFFGELPVSLPTSTHKPRPARAASKLPSNQQPNMPAQHQSMSQPPIVSQAAAASMAPPKNPYMPTSKPNNPKGLGYSPLANQEAVQAPPIQQRSNQYPSQKMGQQSQPSGSYAPAPQGTANSSAPPLMNLHAPPPGQNSYAPPPGQNSYAPPHGQNSIAPSPGQNSYAPPPGGQNSFAPPPGQNSYAPPPGQNSYVPPPGGQNSFAAPPGQNAYGHTPGQNSYPAQSGQNSYNTSSAQSAYGPALVGNLSPSNGKTPMGMLGSMPPQGGQVATPTHLHPFPTMPNQTQQVRKLSNPTPIVTNVTRTQGSNSATSPYVPNAGPYAPSQHQRTHSRASSLVGVKGKEVNPYAPALPTVLNSQAIDQHVVPTPSTLLPTRIRGVSNPRGNIYRTAQPIPAVANPMALLQRQFPVFNWSNSSNAVVLLPNMATNTYGHVPETIKIRKVSDILKESDVYASFPGPLSKLKTKKRDVEKWLEDEVSLRSLNPASQDEVILTQILLTLLRNDGNVRHPEFVKSACSVLNPSIDYNSGVKGESNGVLNVNANAFKLDNSGISIVFGLLESGFIDRALDYTISRGDWALSLVIANFSGPEKFAKIASDYARNSFPFQKSNNKVQHLLPVLLKIFAGNVQSVIEDYTAVPFEGEYANQHWREIMASVLVSGSLKAQEFLCEFGKFLRSRDNYTASEIAFILAGLPLSHLQTPQTGVLFSHVGSNMYTEVYEYILTVAPNSLTPPTGCVHLLPMKIKHASILADYGLFNESQKYMDSINTSMKAAGTRSPFVNPAMIQEFQNLIMRVTESSSTELGWFSGKMSKVNLDKVWGQLDKFIGGDEPKPKSGETGVFSKFSPSVSRTTSTLDFTANVYPVGPGPQNGFNAVSVPSTSSEVPTFNASRYDPRSSLGGPSLGGPPPLVSYNSTNTISKYAPPSAQAITHSKQPTSPFQQGNRQTDLSAPSKYAPSNASSLSLFVNEVYEAPPVAHKRIQPRYSPSVPKEHISNNIYANPAGQVSNCSVNSQNAPPAIAEMLQTPPNFNVRRSSVAAASTDSFMNTDNMRAHNHSPSMQSDISMDYPLEFKSTPKKSHIESGPVPDLDSPVRKKETDLIPETINESPEFEALIQLSNDGKVEDEASSYSAPPATSEVEEVEKSDRSQEKEEILSPVAAIKPPPQMARIKSVNPYAPSTSNTKAITKKNRYGPPAGSTSTNRYSVPSGSSNNSVNIPVSSTEGTDMFGYNGYSAAPKNTAQKDMSPPKSTSAPSNPSNVNIEKGADSLNGNYSSPISMKPLEPPVSGYLPSTASNPVVSNIDESFESNESEVIDSSKATSPHQQALFLNTPASPNTKSMFNPYHSKGYGNNHIDTSFGEFSIPGSPEYTTRANSVVGGPSGLFSSRLSQSHQSALYQQYEVSDDSVRDYIPVVDEEDEDEEEDAASKAALKKKEEEDRKARIAADKVRQKADAAAAKRNANKGGWFPWSGKDDGKPKPIRAKLGEKVNPFYYDEKHKRWLDRNKPIEEQLKSSAPPPPPAMKKPALGPTPGGPSGGPPGSTSGSAPPGSAPPGSAPPGPGKNTNISNTPTPTPPSAPGRSTPSLATAGLDDLLSLGGGSTVSGPRKGKRNARRGYVNVMDQK